MLIEHPEQKIVKPTNPTPPVAPHIVVMTTHGATSDDKAAKSPVFSKKRKRLL